MNGIFLAVGFVLFLVTLTGRGAAGVATANSGGDLFSQIFLWIFSIPFLLIAGWLMWMGLFLH